MADTNADAPLGRRVDYFDNVANRVTPEDPITCGNGALDPGEPGTATNGTAAVDLFRGDPNTVDPPAPFLWSIPTSRRSRSPEPISIVAV